MARQITIEFQLEVDSAKYLERLGSLRGVTKHYKNILLANNIVPNSNNEEATALKLVAQK